MSGLDQALRFIFLEGTLLLALYFAVTFLVLLMQQYGTGQKVMGRLAAQGPVRGAAWAAFAGAVTPFCSCSTVPVLIGLLRAGVAFTAAMTFLVASPVINEGVLMLFLIRGDLWGALVFTVLAAALSIALGLIAGGAGLGRYVTIVGGQGAAVGISGESLMSGAGRMPFKVKAVFSAISAWWELRRASPWLVLGILAGGLLYGVVPDGWIGELAGRFPVEILIPALAALAVPFYLSPSMVVPMGLALVAKGMPVGALVALIVAGVGTSAPELIMLGRLFRWPLIVAYVIGMIGVATVLGLGLQFLLPHALQG
ncbi:permease [Denitromonas iodatirespirans]|uniref:Permease n=1 Tax=Denitromonas iodatirespirans TaxID=2795389 RepID=A0A944DDC1_DENI1|nr:permease [Denitromonas iodatirespirans]MBT0962398.1 permease [Denitromonas iodatirespirans]